jgi:hypothetical protein
MSTIDESGAEVLIEAVYYRYGVPSIEPCETIEDAVGYLDSGEEWGSLSSVGVFVAGEPHSVKYKGAPPTYDEAEAMRAEYAKATAGRTPTEPEAPSRRSGERVLPLQRRNQQERQTPRSSQPCQPPGPR